MTNPFSLAGRPGRGILVIADHASNHVPDGFDLGIDPRLLQEHIAYDIGTEALARGLAEELGAAAHIARVSRLVTDCNRAEDDPATIPEVSDGIVIRANVGLSAGMRQTRIADYHAPYHAAIEALLEAGGMRLLVSVHSFTPALSSRREETRPWHVGLLHNRDDRAASCAMRLLMAEGLTVGDNLPYSGEVYGYTTDRHAEARGLPYLTFEIRQDLLAGKAGIDEWTARLARVVVAVEDEILLNIKEIMT